MIRLFLAAFVFLFGCTSRGFPDTISRISNVSQFYSDLGTQAAKVPNGNEIADWIRRSDKESQAYRSQFCLSTWAYLADTDAGPSAVFISHESFSDGVGPYFSIAVTTKGNPAIAYRYRIKPSDTEMFWVWINSFADN